MENYTDIKKILQNTCTIKKQLLNCTMKQTIDKKGFKNLKPLRLGTQWAIDLRTKNYYYYDKSNTEILFVVNLN